VKKLLKPSAGYLGTTGLSDGMSAQDFEERDILGCSSAVAYCYLPALLSSLSP